MTVFKKPKGSAVPSAWPTLAGTQPSYTSALCAFYVGDSFVLLDALSREIDRLRGGKRSHLITDPPYDEHTHTKMLARKEQGSRAGLAYNEFDTKDLGFDPISHEQIIEAGKLFHACTNGWSLVFGTDALMHPWRVALTEAGASVRRQCLWVKSNPMPKVLGDGPGQGHEPFLASWHTAKGLSEWSGGGRAGIWTGTKDSNPIHKTQKPEWLLASLVELFTDPGDLVIDPFAGSATSGVAAIRAGRRVILIERDAEMAAKAIARVQGTREQLKLGLSDVRAKQVPLFDEPKPERPRAPSKSARAPRKITP